MTNVFREFEQVCIRNWQDQDVAEYAHLVGDPAVMRYIGNGDVRDYTAAVCEVERFQEEIARQGWSRWAVSIGGDGPLIGYAGFSEKPYGIDFGMRFHRDYWGDPSTYISCCLALEYGFEEAGLKQICTITDVKHERGLSFMKKLFSSDPVETSLAFGQFKMYTVAKEQYLENDKENNRARMRLKAGLGLRESVGTEATWSIPIPRPGNIQMGW